jgi:hypothetical protein
MLLEKFHNRLTLNPMSIGDYTHHLRSKPTDFHFRNRFVMGET